MWPWDAEQGLRRITVNAFSSSASKWARSVLRAQANGGCVSGGCIKIREETAWRVSDTQRTLKGTDEYRVRVHQVEVHC